MKPFFRGDNLKTRLIAVILFGVIVFKFLYHVPTERDFQERKWLSPKLCIHANYTLHPVGTSVNSVNYGPCSKFCLEHYNILTEEYFKFEDAVVLQPPTIGQKYAVFSGSTPLARDLTGFNYVFYLPMTAMAWGRIGYGSIIVITGEFKSWKERKELNIILKEILSVNATVVFLPCKEETSIFIAMVARLFVASLLPWDDYVKKSRTYHGTELSSLKNQQSLDNTILVTTDADLWPLSPNMYHFPRGDRTEILATNFGCCGKFTFNGNRYDMLAMSTVAMSVETWREVILPRNSSKAVKTSGDIMQYVVNMFPDNDVHSVVQKGSSEWFIDQKLVSVRVAHWVKDRDRSVILLKNRMTVYDRVDRINWNTQQLDRKVDAHLPLPGFDVNWNKIEPLLDFLYKGRDFVEWMKIKKYKEKFVKAINTQNSSETNTQTQDHLRKKSLLRT